MGEYFDMGIVYPNGASTNYVLTPDDDSVQPTTPLPDDEYDVLYAKYTFSMYRYVEMLQENGIYNTNPHADVSGM